MNVFENIRKWHKESILENVKDKLIKRGYKAEIIDSAEGIAKYIMNIIPSDATTGLGGSVTIREIGLDAMLKERGNKVFDHWDTSLGKDAAAVAQARRSQLTCDYFITGLNAVTLDGRIINIDGVGNRVAAMTFGPAHVIAIAGINKIVKNVEEGLWRIKNIASPQNSKRLNLDTPCATKGYCMECGSAKSVCRVTTIFDHRPGKPDESDFTVILAPIELGL